ncbi:protein kinase domain-containing protein [Dictyobacter vulcani]|nr:protein kinase [Dictyobacter vulcani]
MQSKDGGRTISGRSKNLTGHLDRGTFLHKRYQIQKVIGKGGMGAVYLAKDLKKQGELFAIKEISLSLILPAEQQQTIHNFKVEAKMLWSLNHPNLPTVHGVFTQNERYFLVMDYIDGSTLEELLERNGGPFPERRVLDWARQLCDVLAYLHSHSPPIIFRDMKPGNIMLTRNGQIKLIDFGIARFFRSSHAQDTQVLGTPGYAPPEQYGKAQTDERSDIYALGMTIFHLLTNTLSDEGFGLEHVRKINPRISPMVARALEKATSIKPSDRYESVEMFRHALLGVGTFGFATGEVASTPEELATLCATYPEEAAEYLLDKEIESWLLDLGEDELSEIANHLAHTVPDPVDAIEQFVEAILLNKGNAPVLNPQTVINSSNTVSNVNVKLRNPATRHHTPPPVTQATSISSRLRQPQKSHIPVPVSPRTLDFGTVYPGISAPLKMSIGDSSGYAVSGTIHTSDAWIQLSQTDFDAPLTEVNVRVNSLQLSRHSHYSGVIFIQLDDDDRGEISVKVEADVEGFIVRNKRHPGRTNGADLDYYDDDDLDSQGEMPVVSGGNQVMTPPILLQRHGKDLEKYGTPYMNDWDPWPMGPILRRWRARILTLLCSFMMASLGYIWLLPWHPLPLGINPIFLLTLFIAIPAATVGSVVLQYKRNWRPQDLYNRFLTGMTSSLLVVSLAEMTWQIAVRTQLGWIQLVVMLAFVAIGATIGVSERPNRAILGSLKSVQTSTRQSRIMMIILAVLLGFILGIFLTFGFGLNFFTLFGILLAIGITVGIVERVDYLVKYKRL